MHMCIDMEINYSQMFAGCLHALHCNSLLAEWKQSQITFVPEVILVYRHHLSCINGQEIMQLVINADSCILVTTVYC